MHQFARTTRVACSVTAPADSAWMPTNGLRGRSIGRCCGFANKLETLQRRGNDAVYTPQYLEIAAAPYRELAAHLAQRKPDELIGEHDASLLAQDTTRAGHEQSAQRCQRLAAVIAQALDGTD
jgi:hypothetical protein